MITVPWSNSSNPTTGATAKDAVVQVSELRLARSRDIPGFLVASLKLRRTALATEGNVGLSLRAQPMAKTFWTLSAWESQDAINRFVRSSEHRKVMTTYRDRMAGSHFHTFFAADQTDLPPGWKDGMTKLEESK